MFFKKLIVNVLIWQLALLSFNLYGAIPNGFPIADTTGIKGQGLTTNDLSPQGTTEITVDNTTLDKIYFTGRLTISADNVTVQNCYFIDISNFAFRCNGNNTVIKDSTVVGPDMEGEAIQALNVTVLRCDLSGYSDGLKADNNTTVEDCYIHDLYDDGSTHNDCVQSMQGTNITIQNNTLISTWQMQTSAVILKPDFGVISDVQVINNYMSGGSYIFYSVSSLSNAAPTGVQFVNNIIEPNSYLFGRLNTEGSVSISCNTYTSGNPIEENPACQPVSISNAGITPNTITNNQDQTLIISCEVYSGVSISSVTVDLSSFGESAAYPLTNLSGNYYETSYVITNQTEPALYNFNLRAENSSASIAVTNMELKVVDNSAAYLTDITNFLPLSGSPGSTVTIYGTGFGSNKGLGQVFFNGIEAAAYTSWNNNQIVVTVPAGDTSGQLIITNDQGFGDSFGVISPVSQFIFLNGDSEPLSAKSTAVWSGDASGTDTAVSPFNGANCVKFTGNDGNDQLVVYRNTAVDVSKHHTFEFYLRSDTGTEDIEIKLGGYAYDNYANSIIIYNVPTVWTKYSYTIEELTNGAPFEADQHRSVVFFFDSDGGSIYVDDMQFPAVNEPLFTKTTDPVPVITGFSPLSAAAGDTITISGSNFLSSRGSGGVSFQGASPAGYLSWSDTIISVTVPAGAIDGQLTVSNNFGNQTLSSASFNLDSSSNTNTNSSEPELTFFTPRTGCSGTIVRIYGNNFGTNRGSGKVKFNGVNALSYYYWSNSEIQTAVPAGFSPGQITIEADNGGTVQSVTSFKYATSLYINSVTPTNAAPGEQLVITGSNFMLFQGSGNVYFDGTPAESYTLWNDTNIILTIPSTSESGPVTMINNCFVSGSSSVNVIISQNFPAAGSFRIRPNYTKKNDHHEIFIDYSVTNNQEVLFEIYNVSGKLVRSISADADQAGTLEIGRQWLNDQGYELASGLYLVYMKVDGEIVNKGNAQKFGWVR